MEQPVERLSARTKLLYGMGDTGFSLSSTIIGVYLAIFLTDVVHLKPGLVATAIFIASWDYINDPLIGYISDRVRTRWGRRRPFLLFGALPFALAFTLLWWIPPWSSQFALAAYYALAYLLYDTAATFVYMPYYALTPELTEDYDERTALNAYRMAFSIGAGLVAFTVPLMMVGSFQPQNASRIWFMAAMFGLASALPLLGTFLGTRERPEHQTLAQPGVRESLSAAVHNRPFMFAVGIFLLTWVTVDLLQSLLLYFLKYWLLLEAQSDLILGTIFVVAFAVLPFWSVISRRWDKRRAYMVGIAFWALVQFILILLRPGVPLWAVVGLAALAGIGVSAAHVIPWSIIPDAVEWDELRTGQRHEGMFYSLVTLMQKIASSIALPVALLALDWSGYVPNVLRQSPRTLLTIRALVGVLPAFLLAGGIAFAAAYPLSRDKHAELRRELARKRQGTGSAVMEETTGRLSVKTKILYGMGDGGFSLSSTIIGVYLAIFLTDVVRLKPGLAAAAIFIGRSWDYVNDPLIGYISDRTRTRWGRRRPFLLFGALPFGLAFTMLWWIPPWSSQFALAVYYALAYLLFDTAATFVYMPYYALTPELTEDYDERTSLNAYRMTFTIGAGLAAFTIPLMMVGSFEPQNAARVGIMAATMGLASALPVLGTFLGTRERPEYQALRRPGLKESLAAAIHNRPFLFAVGIFLLTGVTVDLMQSLLLYFLKYWLLLEAQSDLILGTMFVVALLTLPFWSFVSRRWDKRTAYIAGIAFWAVVQLALIMLHPGVSLPIVVLLSALAGVGVSAAHMIPWAIIPDAVEWDEMQTGERHEGMFYSLVALMQKVASSIALPLALLALNWSGYVPGLLPQASRTLLAIRGLVGAAPAFLLGGGIALAAAYPLNRERHAALRRELKRRREGTGSAA